MVKPHRFARKTPRPEELYQSPLEYIENLKPTTGFKNAQIKLTLELIELMGIKEKRGKVIDLGCGFGFSSEILKELGFEVVGIDVSEKMVKYTRSKGIETIVGDFRELEKYFGKDSFDYGISISSLQWISKSREDLKKFARGCNYVIKYMLGIQFYPKTDKEVYEVKRVLEKCFGKTEVYIIAPKTKKERIYVISKKQ